MEGSWNPSVNNLYNDTDMLGCQYCEVHLRNGSVTLFNNYIVRLHCSVTLSSFLSLMSKLCVAVTDKCIFGNFQKIYIKMNSVPNIYLGTVTNFWNTSLLETCLYSGLFWSLFFCIRTEYGEILFISPYSVRMRENTGQNNSKYGHFLRSASGRFRMPLTSFPTTQTYNIEREHNVWR